MRWLLGKILCLAGRHYWLKPGSGGDKPRKCLRCGDWNTDDFFEPYSYPPPREEDPWGAFPHPGDKDYNVEVTSNPMLEFFHGTGNREKP